ncbi:tail fiber domain-containing protein [Erwinia sp. DT-104]|uniref:tail fiber domain-containing protein n=1 Tax=Erwinia sp. DT-104 TaxID=3396161 RepID=UPI003F1BE311
MPAGTITLTNGSATVTGISTAFTTELKAGDFLGVIVGGVPYTLIVTTIASNTSLTIASSFTGPTTSGLAWYAVPATLQTAITQQAMNDMSKVIRGMIQEKANWQGFYTGTGNTTIKLPDGTSVTGPSWPAMVNTISGKLDRSGGTLTGKIELPGIELKGGTTPYLDFHYNNSEADYTSRVYAETATRLAIASQLRVQSDLLVNGTSQFDSNLMVAGYSQTGRDVYLGLGSPVNSQGLHLRWNEQAGTGMGSLVVNPGAGNGGFQMRFVNPANNVQTGSVLFTAKGGVQAQDYISSPNQLWSQGGRVKFFTAITGQYLGVNIDGSEYGVNIFASDERLKNNIKDAAPQGAYEAIKQIRLKSFDLKVLHGSDDDPIHWEYGFIAQQAQEHLKGAVIMDRLSYLQIDPLALCGYLLGAVQHLQDKVETLESKAEATDANISELLKRMKAIDGLDA